MSDKFIIDFLHEWLHDGGLRCKVLHQEKTQMGVWGLDQKQREVLTSLDKDKIVVQILDELGLDLDTLKKIVYPPPGSPTGAGAAAGYDEGRTHIRRIDPNFVDLNQTKTVTLFGQGFVSTPANIEVQCSKGGVTQTFQATEVNCGVDVWQRVEVPVTLDVVGEWVVNARNSGETNWSNPSGTIHVL
jgi:hypothetical protein